MSTHLNGSNGRRRGSGSTRPQEITPELVRQVADRVYELWLEDLRLQHERYRPALGQTRQTRRGGF